MWCRGFGGKTSQTPASCRHKCRIIYTVLYAAESRLGWDTILQYAQFAEFIKIVPAEFYYLGSAHTHFEVRASIISMMLASSLWRIFPLSDLLKSGTDEENSFSLYKILSGEPNLFTTFVIWLCASTTIESTWSSGLIWFITIWFATIKLRKICHPTYLLDWLFYWKSKKWISSEAYYPTIKSLHELWTVEAKSTLTTLGSTPYKITTFLNEQRNPKWKSHV